MPPVSGRWRRRDVLAAGAGLLAAPACGGNLTALRHRDPIGDPFGLPASVAFPLGVSSGDVEKMHARVVTRWTGTGRLELRLLEGDVPGPLLVFPVVVGDQGMVQVEVSGLSPWHRYVYAFVELGADGSPVARSPVGQFRTPPLDDVTVPLTLTASSCARQRFGFQTLARAAEIDAELHLLVGDTSYNDNARTLPEFRARWLETLAREEYVQLRAATPVLGVWDDHEVLNNWDAEMAPADVVAAGRQVFLEHVPARLDDPPRLWRRRRWGGTAEFFLLDLYSEQRPSKDEFVSRAQLDWLVDGVTRSSAVFKVVVTSLPMSRMPPHFQVWQHGRWDAFPDQRREILQRLEDAGTTGVLWVTGDVHMPVVGRLGLTGNCRGQHEIMLGPAAHDVNPLWRTMLPPQFEWAGHFRNITVLQLNPEGRRVTATFVDESGTPRAARTFRA